MKESPIQKALLEAIGSIAGMLVERMNTGAATNTNTGTMVHFGTVGGPDVRITLQGRAVAVECKSSTGVQRKRQIVWQRAHEAAGGTYLLCRDVHATILALADLATGTVREALLTAAATLPLAQQPRS